ncbi:hypothetical protein BH09ACT5_BH09ACT5_16350 [soil metagenome]
MTAAVIAAGLVVLAVVAAGAVVARLRLWSAPRSVPAASSRMPDGSVLGGADVLVDPSVALAAQLIDWHVRGVVTVGSRGPVREHDPEHGVSGGPHWIITLRDDTGLREDERMALAGMFDDDARGGAVYQLAPDDQESRRVLGEAQDLARGVRHEEWGPRRPVAVPVAVALMGLAAVAAVGVVIAAVARLPQLGAGGTVAVVVAALILAAFTVLLAARPSLPPAAELAFAEQVRAVAEFIRAADRSQVTPELLGWAMLLRMPPPWPAAVPPALAPVVEHPTSFRMIPRPPGLEYTG